MDAPRSYEVIAAIVLFVGFGGFVAVGTWVWNLSQRLSTLGAEAHAAQQRADDAFKLAVEVKDALSVFRVEAAQRFVTDEMLAKVEERVIAAIDRLADRLDRAFEARQRATRANVVKE